MRVFIVSDMEGVAGITKWDQVSGGKSLYEEGRALYTEEINAAVRGARAAGATDIVVMD
jgi:D-amino peptidase